MKRNYRTLWPATLCVTVAAILVCCVLVRPVRAAQQTGSPPPAAVSPLEWWNGFKTFPRFVRAADIAHALGGTVLDPTPEQRQQRAAGEIPRPGEGGPGSVLLPAGITALLAYNKDNSLFVLYDDPAAANGLKKLLTLLDVKPRRVAVRVETLLVIRDAAGRELRRLPLLMSGETPDGQEGQLTTTLGRAIGGGVAAATDDAPTGQNAWPRSGNCFLRVTPRVNADGTIALRVNGNVEFEWRAAAPPVAATNTQKTGATDAAAARDPLRISHTFNSVSEAADGRAATLMRSASPFGTGTAEITITLTPHLLAEPQGRTGLRGQSSSGQSSGAQTEAR